MTNAVNKAVQRNRNRLIKNAKPGRSFDSSLKYYVYVLLDPRKKGTYNYRYGGFDFKFGFEPFYVGKGKGNRCIAHTKTARKWMHRAVHDHKINKIKSILESGKTPIVKKVTDPSTELDALAKEMLLISVIGRYSEGGTLTNLTLGGEGHSGYRASEETKERMRSVAAMRSARQKASIERKRLASLDRIAMGEAVSKAHKSNSPQRWKEIQSKRLSTMANFSEDRKALRAKRASESMKLRNQTNPLPVIECPYCGMNGTSRGLARWHFNNCKFR